MSVSIYIWGTTPRSPSALDPGDWVNYVPFSTAPDGRQSSITVEEVVPGTGSAHLELYDLTNQFTFAELAPIWIVDDGSGENLFVGIIQKVKFTPVATWRLITIDAVDVNYVCDTTLVGVPDGSGWEVTDSATGPVATNVDSGSTDSTPHALFSSYWQYGVATIDTTTYVDTTLIPAGLAPYWDRITLRNAMDNLAGMCGPLVTWWIDQGTGHANGTTTCYLHFTTFASATNVGVAGSGAWMPGGWQAGGPLTLLFPVANVNVIAGNSGTAPYGLTDQAPDYTTTWDAENVSMEVDYSAFRFSLYVRGGTDYTGTISQVSPGPPPAYAVTKVETGGTGWVAIGGPNGGDGGSSYMSEFYNQPNAISHGTRNSLGTAALAAMQTPLVRGTADLNLDPSRGSGVKPFHAGQSITLTYATLGLSNANFFIFRSTTSFLSGNDARRVSLDWGTAPRLNTAQRRQAQKSAVVAPQKGATKQLVAAAQGSCNPGSSVVIGTQMTNSNDQPWPIAGKVVDWTCQVLDASTGADITSTTSFTLNPTASTTDASGKATTTLTTDASVTDALYKVTATTPA